MLLIDSHYHRLSMYSHASSLIRNKHRCVIRKYKKVQKQQEGFTNKGKKCIHYPRIAQLKKKQIDHNCIQALSEIDVVLGIEK